MSIIDARDLKGDYTALRPREREVLHGEPPTGFTLDPGQIEFDKIEREKAEAERN